MKMLVIVILTLICFMCHSSDGETATNLILSSGCCESYSRTHIPLGRILHVAMTPASCDFQKKAIVFTAVQRKFCIDPEWKWAKSILNKFQKRDANNSTTSGPVNVRSKFEHKIKK